MAVQVSEHSSARVVDVAKLIELGPYVFVVVQLSDRS